MERPKILFPTDFSSAAARAFPLLRERVRIDAAEVHLLYVSEDLTDFEHYWGSGLDRRHTEGIREYAERISKRRLEQLCKCELGGCKSYHLHFAFGTTADEILKAIREIGVDEVVIARPPAEGVSSFGAAADVVRRLSPVPVTAIDAPPAAGPPTC